jgi:hypothetical protein
VSRELDALSKDPEHLKKGDSWGSSGVCSHPGSPDSIHFHFTFPCLTIFYEDVASDATHVRFLEVWRKFVWKHKSIVHTEPGISFKRFRQRTLTLARTNRRKVLAKNRPQSVDLPSAARLEVTI